MTAAAFRVRGDPEPVRSTHLPPQVLEAHVELVLSAGRFQLAAVVVCWGSEGAPVTHSCLPSQPHPDAWPRPGAPRALQAASRSGI